MGAARKGFIGFEAWQAAAVNAGKKRMLWPEAGMEMERGKLLILAWQELTFHTSAGPRQQVQKSFLCHVHKHMIVQASTSALSLQFG